MNKYKIIYADPPWSYGDKQNTPLLGGAVKHYGLMSTKDISELPIKNITEDNAVLFLWKQTLFSSGSDDSDHVFFSNA